MSVPTDRSYEPLAIIGMACRLPGAKNLEEYWRLIVEGRCAVGEVPAERFNQALYFDPNKGTRGKSYSKLACVLESREFDAARCPVSPELAASVDSTHLLMTGVAAEALRHAGLDPFALPNRNAAIFIGHAQGSSQLGQLTFGAYVEEAVSLLAQTPGYQDLSPLTQQQVQDELIEQLRSRLPAEVANTRNLGCNMVAGTVAKAFGLSGPWLALNSACASSLHAMLLGARALQLGRADMVIVGGASDCKNDSLVLFSAAQTLSTDGSRPFDADADGLVMSEGYVALVMKTLRQALADGDPVQAVVRGLGIASDGRGKSLWAPRKEGQMKAMQRAYRSGVEMAGLQYLEAHATSTQVGDATELETLGEVLGPKFPPGKKIPVTSAKANIGHTLECAGIAGVIKTVLCMQRQTYPPAINIRNLNPKVDWEKAPYYIPQAPAAWEAPDAGQPRRAAVNAFGIGGLNMHVVLDEFTPAARQLVMGAPVPAAIEPADRAIAVVGMGCVFPGGIGLEKFWETLATGRDPKVSPTAERWTKKALAAQSSRPAPVRAGFITDFAYDWRRHKVPPKQVAEADPLQFMLLEGAEQALNDAGYDRRPLEREKCGVVVGTEFGGEFCDHLEMGLRLPEMQHALSGLLSKHGVSAEASQSISAKFADTLLKKWPSLVDETGSFTSSTLASRITKTLDLAGGAVSIDSGSTSAMSGLSIAIDMLLSGDNDLMICAAGQRRMGPNAFDALKVAGIAATQTPHNVLDAGYDGVVPAEGVGVVVLKRLADARRDGDRIHAVIRSLGIAHAPTSAQALQLAAERSCAMAGIDPTEITLVEIDTDEQLSPGGEELRAVLAGCQGERHTPLIVGSSTATLGHMGGASPMSALIKASLEVAHAQAAPIVGLQTPASALNACKGAVQLPRSAVKWSGPRIAALASWSKGQACHLILESAEPVAPTPRPASAVTRQSPVSAATPAGALQISRFGAASLAGLQAKLDTAIGNVSACWPSTGCEAFKAADRFRLAIVADGPESLARKLQLARPQLENLAARQVLEQQGIFYRQFDGRPPRVAFIFPGQGSQYVGMLRELVATSPAAAQMLRDADAAMAAKGFPSFSKLAWEQPTQLGSDVWTTQVSMLLADAVMLAAVRDRGIQPDVVLGHSFGEFPALFAAGVWDFATAVQMTRARCEGISAVAVGDSGMLATDAPAAEVAAIIASTPGHMYLANMNAPDQTVVGAKRANLEKLAAALQAKSFQARILSVPAAFHTPLMAGASRLLEDQLKLAVLCAPRVPLISTVTNHVVADAEQVRRNLGAQLTTPVRYAELIDRLAAEQPTVFVEVGPQQTFTKLNRRILNAEALVIACDNPKRPGLEPLLGVQALLECLGVAIGTATPSAAPKAAVSESFPASKSSAKPMHDQIPHFDATETRRAKMRGGGPSKPAATANGQPAPAPVPHSAGATPKAPPAAPLISAAPRIRPAATPSVAPAPQANGSAPTIHPAAKNGTYPPAATTPPAEKPSAPAAQSPAPKPPAARPASDELAKFLVNFVVEQTGYPAEVVELDADLEADLGIDSIKKAQLFGELQEYFDVGTSATNLSLDDFPTLRHVLDFLSQAPAAQNGHVAEAPASAAPAAKTTPVAPVSSAPPAQSSSAPTSSAASNAARPNANELESFLINFVVEQTGYPAEVVELDADLEADLGIDSIKKAQLFGELQEYFDVGTSATNLSLDDFPTLRHVLNFLANAPPPAVAEPPEMPAATAPSLAPVAQATAEPVAASAPSAAASPGELESFLINFVVEQTGYPAEVVELDADLEADLGIDSIKKAQLFGELQEYFDVGTSATNLSLDDFPTLRHVLNFLSGANSSGANSPAAPAASEGAQQVSATVAPAPSVAVAPVAPVAHASHVSSASTNSAELEAFLINFVVEQTGYPAEVVDLDADLEADLGIDSIKKAQLFGELQEYFDVGTSATNLSLDDFPTLRHVLAFLSGSSASAATAATSHVESASAAAASHANNGHVAKVAEKPAERTAPIAGTPYEKGWQVGVAHATEVRKTLRDCVASLGSSDQVDVQRMATTTELPPDELDQLQGLADAVEVPLACLLAHRESVLSRLNGEFHGAAANNGHAGRAAGASSEPAVPPLSASAVTTRYVLEMREAPLRAAARVPAWSGAAIVLGNDDVALALTDRLEASGVVVHPLDADAPLESLLADVERIAAAGPAPHLFITTANDALSGDWWNADRWLTRREQTMLTPFFVCQKWVGLAAAGGWLSHASLVATTQLGGDFGLSRGAEAAAGGALAGLLKAIFIEYTVMQGLKGLRVKAIDSSIGADPSQLCAAIFGELASGAMDDEVALVDGRRLVPFAVERPLHSAKGSGIRRGGTWVITGGARGITAACALELGRRWNLKLHLLGASAAPQVDPAWRSLDAAGLERLKASTMIAARQSGQPAAQAWDRVRRDLEIDRSLRTFAEAGVDATYHACDVADRQQLAHVLEAIRRTSGPIEGVLHGAGIDRSCRFDKKQFDGVDQTIGAKVDGAAHLMALTRRDPIRHFIGFGSISGRLGSFGQADYCLASDMLCKLIGAYRRERSWVHAVGFHWHPWDEVGMAARPETKNVLQGKSDLTLMPLAEGISHFLGELASGCPEPEVLITERRHWERFAAGLGLATTTPTSSEASSPAQAVPDPQRPAAVTHEPPLAAEPVELRTHRCHMRALEAPLTVAEDGVQFDSPVWILGNNNAAATLRQRLEAGGVAVQQFIGSDADAVLAEMDRLWAAAPARHLFLMTGRDAAATNLLDANTSTSRRAANVVLPFLAAQRWYKLLASRKDEITGTLVAAVSLGGDFGFSGNPSTPEGGAISGLLKAVHIEDSRRETPRVRVKVMDAPAGESDQTLIDALLWELAGNEPEVEVCWSQGTRRVVRPLPAPLDPQQSRAIPRGGVWVVTGGARGITAIAARELARRHGWNLHLIGKSPAPLADAAWRNYGEAEMKAFKTTLARQAVSEGRSPSEAWDRVMKDVEIYNNLRQFAEAGVTATYHACDISDRQALAAVLDEVRRTGGPITGVLHGAGVIDPSRFENKRRDILSALIGAKFDGTLNLMALTQRDPLAYFVGFGSISGRFGGNGLTDYAAGNDVLAKLIDWHRASRPACASACIHWESWEGSGMATLPRFAWGPKSVMNMKYMLPEEGVRRLEQELEVGLPEAEVLYTFGDFYPMFYPHEQRPLGDFDPAALTAAEDEDDAGAAFPLLAQVRRDDGGLVADVPLDPVADPFLIGHRLRGKPLLPVVVGLEALAEAARAASGRDVVGFENVQMLDGLLFHLDRGVTAQARAVASGDHGFECALTCDFRNRSGGLIQKDRPYLRGRALVGARAGEVPQLPAAPGEWTDFSYPEDAPIYHGAVFRGATGIHCDRQGGWGRITALPMVDLVGSQRVRDWTVPSCVLDAALYACGIHLWMHETGAVSLPKEIDHLQIGRAARDGEQCLVYFVCRDISADSATYDFTLVGVDGQLIAAAQGYRKVILTRGGGQ